MTISTHVLDAARGRPASGLTVGLERLDPVDGAVALGVGVTDEDGRCPALTEGLELVEGSYRLRFETGDWFAAEGIAGFYPHVEVVFVVTDAASHHHVPLLLSPFAYSTYRGS